MTEHEHDRKLNAARSEVSRRETFVRKAQDEAAKKRAELDQKLEEWANAQALVALQCDALDRAQDRVHQLVESRDVASAAETILVRR